MHPVVTILRRSLGDGENLLGHIFIEWRAGYWTPEGGDQNHQTGRHCCLVSCCRHTQPPDNLRHLGPEQTISLNRKVLW